jgi:hypothetical protein
MSSPNIQYVNFTISSSGISTSDTFGNYPISNSTGEINQNRTITKWFNINFRDILGELYNEYSSFALRLNAVQFVAQTWGTGTSDRLLVYRLKGLPFLNNTYDVIQKCNVDYSIIGGGVIDTNSSSTIIYPSNTNVTNFERCEIVNLQIELARADGQEVNTGANQMIPRMTYHFSIYGMEKLKK